MIRAIYLVVLFLSVQIVYANDWGHMMYPGTGHMFWNFGFIGMFFMILFWVAVILLIYWVVKKFIETKQPEKPINILKERYAKGEITKKEYQKKIKELKL